MTLQAVVQATTPIAAPSGTAANLIVNPVGGIHVVAPIYAGTAGSDAVASLAGFGRRDTTTNSGIPTPTAMGGFILNGTSWDRLVKPNQTARLLSSAATTNATNVKASAGNVHKIVGNNTVAVKKYLKLYNKATAPTVGTDTPVLTYVIPISAAFSFDLSDLGSYFSVGIGYAITAAAADADSTAIGAGDIECMNILYS